LKPYSGLLISRHVDAGLAVAAPAVGAGAGDFGGGSCDITVIAEAKKIGEKKTDLGMVFIICSYI
jgi:hypothetical protein